MRKVSSRQGCQAEPSGYFPTFKENQLTGEKIKALLLGSAITGINFFIGQWWIDCKKNGEFFWRGINSSDIGKIRVEGDMICTQYQERWWGLEQCGTVFRNPSGTPETKNEYFVIQRLATGIFTGALNNYTFLP